MKAQELHIGLDLELQKINSNSNRNLLSQEKDWFLNKEVEKYINKHTSREGNVIKAGFQNNQKRIRDLQNLINTQPIIPSLLSEGKAELVLPSDFFGYIRSEIKIGKNCDNTNIQKIKKVLYRTEFGLNLTMENLLNLRIRISKDGNSIELFDEDDLPEGYIEALNYQKQSFMMIKALKILLERKLKENLDSNFQLYWENYGNEYIKNTFILISEDIIDRGLVDATTDGQTIFNTIEEENYSYLDKDTPLLGSIRIMDDEFYTDIKKSNLSKSRIDSIIGRFQQMSIMLNFPINSILGEINLIYLKKSNLIDLDLDNGLNLNDVSCNEIIVNTAKYIKAVIDSGNWEKYTRENILIE